jgi:hypothetical protein
MQLTQIVPMFDEETGEEGPAIVKARILDPYVILLRVDGSMVVYKLDKSKELAEEKLGIKVGTLLDTFELLLNIHRVPNTNLQACTKSEKEGPSPGRKRRTFSPC